MRTGELLEKSTRVLTEEEKAQLEVPFVGKNGEKRKVEVRYVACLSRAFHTNGFYAVYPRETEVKKVVPV